MRTGWLAWKFEKYRLVRCSSSDRNEDLEVDVDVVEAGCEGLRASSGLATSLDSDQAFLGDVGRRADAARGIDCTSGA